MGLGSQYPVMKCHWEVLDTGPIPITSTQLAQLNDGTLKIKSSNTPIVTWAINRDVHAVCIYIYAYVYIQYIIL
jgi:hypothetical protein